MMSVLSDIAKQAMMQPQEAMLEVKNKKNNLAAAFAFGTWLQKHPVLVSVA